MGYYKNQEDKFTKRAEKYDEQTEGYLKRARAAEQVAPSSKVSSLS